MPSIYHNSDSASSTTKSAVEDGTLIVRNQDEQKQNVDDLSRDTDNANNPLGQIFDKQKEQDKMDALDLVRDIAAQAKDVVNKYDRIQAQNDVDKNKLPDDAIKKARDTLGDKATEDEVNKLAYSYAVDKQVQINQEKGKTNGGMGSSVSKGIDAATAIVSGLITGDFTGGLAGTSAPYLAGVIKEKTTSYDEKGHPIVNTEANLIAHAILGAAVAAAQGNSALAGGIGAVSGEAAADYIRKTLYDGRDPSDLTQAEKENISALAPLASGLAVAAGSGGNIGDVGTAVAGSKLGKVGNKVTKVDNVVSDANKINKAENAVTDANKSSDWKYAEGEYSQKPTNTLNVEAPTNGKYDANNLPYNDTKQFVKQEYVDILSEEAKNHILYGDKPGSGGHLFPGQANKTTFPSNWPAEKIINDIGDIVTSSNTQWYAQTGTGGLYTNKGQPAKWVSYTVKDGVRVKVVYMPATGKVVTAYPDNAPLPNYKQIK
ncbi:EndoU domain-containing protein [Orbus wheelerorum]|uniref:EndoU domain-containing protein n=1 Tax=Orbus wheelerorum TaxID=3074111 RepID=UPI00370D8BC3